jgi:aspartate carbamoyltransferase
MEFEAFQSSLADPAARRSLLFRDGRPFHVLLAHQFERRDLEELCDTATAIRRLDRHDEGRALLRGVLAEKRILNLFAQPSTRTNESFVAAGEKLGASVRVVSDLRTSSFEKGETVEDSVRVLSSFYDVLVTRHHDDDFAARAAWTLSRSRRPIPVLSAGSGKSEHPTQALLDIYTLRHSFASRGGIDARRLLFVGDIARNRAIRSLAMLLLRFEVKRIDVACPKEHAPDPTFLQPFSDQGVEVVMHATVADAIRAVGRQIDAIYVTRMQREWDGPDARPGTPEAFVLDPRHRAAIRDDCVILHPLPRINELPDAWEDHPGFVVWRQVRNGMWMRAALLATIHGAAPEIRRRAQSLGLVDG